MRKKLEQKSALDGRARPVAGGAYGEQSKRG